MPLFIFPPIFWPNFKIKTKKFFVCYLIRATRVKSELELLKLQGKPVQKTLERAEKLVGKIQGRINDSIKSLNIYV